MMVTIDSSVEDVFRIDLFVRPPALILFSLQRCKRLAAQVDPRGRHIGVRQILLVGMEPALEEGRAARQGIL